MKIIYLTKGLATLVDDEDYEWLSQHKWFSCGKTNKEYAVRHGKDSEGSKARKFLYMHREIMKAENGIEVDHINQDPLDNQKHNLRLCTSQQNNCNNKRSPKRNKGVDKRETIIPSYRAKIAVNGRYKYLGSYRTERDAALAYDREAIKLYGEFASLNYPELLLGETKNAKR